MTSPMTDKHTIAGLNGTYKSSPGHLSFTYCSKDKDPSNLLSLTMFNPALHILPQNHSTEKPTPIPLLQFPDTQKMSNNKIGNFVVTPLLLSEYEKIKEKIDKSGLLAPNENLMTKNRGHCYWANCFFQSDIEENFKRHMADGHQLTSSALAQLEISLERSIQLSNLLIKEQNLLYNMLLHLDQKLRGLSNEPSVLTDYHYLSLLLSKFKQDSNRQDGILDPNISCSEPTGQITLQTNHCLSSRHQHSPILSTANLSQQLIDTLSSALMRPQPIDVQPQTMNYQQPPFAASHISSFSQSVNGNIQSVTKPESMSPSVINLAATHANNRCSPVQLPTNHETNLRDILSQPRSPNSGDVCVDRTAFKHIQDKRGRSLQRKIPDGQGKYPNNMSDREYYRQYAVRPSASYVNLIKAAILDSPKNELSLNEIYVWMQAEFAYFRDREQKWKNAIRHNLSLHKCFQRKHGKLWTFNEDEYNMKKSRNRFQYNVQATESEITDGEAFDEDEDGHDDTDERGPAVIKKETGYNVEDRSQEAVLDTDEWSNYLHRSTLKTSSSPLDASLLPSHRADICLSNSPT